MSPPETAAAVAAVLAVGSELLSGRSGDLNTRGSARILLNRGIEVAESRTVPDDRGAVSSALSELACRFDLVVVTGGLGPTDDDLTAAAVADAFGLGIVRNREAERMILEGLQGRTPATSTLLSQADLPEGAAAVENPRGSAPGFILRTERGGMVLAVPGFPEEAAGLLPLCLDAAGIRAAGGPPEKMLLRTWGVPESELASAVGILAGSEDLDIAFLPSYGRVDLIFAKTPDSDKVYRRIKEQLGIHTYGSDPERSLEMVLSTVLLGRGATLSVAESCTGGLVGSLLTEIPGASNWYTGGVITYSDSLKTSVLGVDPDLLIQHGAVSRETALAMAHGVRELTGSDIGAAVTGIAGPSGGSVEKPVGTVCMAVVSGGSEESVTRQFRGPRMVVRRASASYLLGMLLTHPEVDPR